MLGRFEGGNLGKDELGWLIAPTVIVKRITRHGHSAMKSTHYLWYE